ncbi:phosphotransferase family protein [Yinghuangia sp. YIM S09857]|uniref:phosphotransferase family protein n=1 Tax=Yinghuangia sp. YIM S09857 TaxID=3436929 RepID=UPI003F52B953
MTPALLPEAVAALVGSAVGPVADARVCSWPRPGSNVWEVRTQDGIRVFAKVHATDKFHSREVDAYRTWVPHLGDHAPALLAGDAALPGIVITAVPGTPVKLQPLTCAAELRVHALAGAVARRIHDGVPGAAPTAPAVPADAAAKYLARAPITGRALALARGLLADAAAVRLPVVATHGDFQPRNWLYVPDEGRLRVVDFERAEPAAAVRDFRLLPNGAWLGRWDLREAFLGGYGRALSADEEAALAGYVVLDALDSARWGRENGDAEVEARGLAGLARLRNGP